MYLDDHFHQVLLRNNVLAIDDLLQDAWENCTLVHVEVDTIKLAKPNKICSDQDTQFAALQFTFLAVSRVSLVLQANPELVHFDKIRQDK